MLNKIQCWEFGKAKKNEEERECTLFPENPALKKKKKKKTEPPVGSHCTAMEKQKKHHSKVTIMH